MRQLTSLIASRDEHIEVPEVAQVLRPVFVHYDNEQSVGEGDVARGIDWLGIGA